MAVRKGKWKAIVQDIMSGNRKILLFDLENDLREEHDVAAEHPEIVEEMRAIMQREHTEPENPRFHF